MNRGKHGLLPPHNRTGPQWQRLKVKDAEAFERVEAIKAYRIFEEGLASERHRFVTTFSLASAHQLERAGGLEGAHAIWSMWPGYLKEASGKKLLAFLDDHQIPFSVHHTSGHASIADLRRLADAIGAARVVPIHTFGSHRFTDHFQHVDAKPDGEWWEV